MIINSFDNNYLLKTKKNTVHSKCSLQTIKTPLSSQSQDMFLTSALSLSAASIFNSWQGLVHDFKLLKIKAVSDES